MPLCPCAPVPCASARWPRLGADPTPRAVAPRPAQVGCSPAAVLDWALESVEAVRLLAEAARHDALAVPAHRAEPVRACLVEVVARLRAAGRAKATARVIERVAEKVVLAQECREDSALGHGR